VYAQFSVMKIQILSILFFSLFLENSAAQPTNSIYFNGTTSQIIFCNSCGDLWSDAEFASTEFTVSFWAKWVDLDTTETVVRWSNMVAMNNSSGSGSGDDGTFWFQHNRNNTRFEFALETDVNRRFIQSSTKPIEGMWYHLTGVYDESRLRLYVNGAEESSVNHTGSVNYSSGENTNLLIGRWARDATRNFNGSIGDLRIWKKALNPTEVQNQMISAPNAADTNLLLYLTLDDPDNVQDLSTYSIPFADTIDISPFTGAFLPVELLYFNGINQGKVNVIQWATATELNNHFFIVERSTDGENWEELATVFGAGTTQKKQNYSLEDRSFENEINYYRLTQVDFDGQMEVFPLTSVHNRENVHLIRTVNSLGQRVDESYKGLIIEQYSDGTSIKRYKY